MAFTNGWFRTADLGRRDQDGYYVNNVRKKEMINRGGENISPREIDEVLMEHATNDSNGSRQIGYERTAAVA
ncbi:MAG: hypothetical protein ACOVLE_01650, partial [Pirellula staleyi]